MASSSALHQPSLRLKLGFGPADQAAVLGVVGLRTRLKLYVVPGEGQPLKELRFAVDSGASYSLISLAMAEGLRLPVPPPGSETDLRLQTPQGAAAMRVRPGRIRAWWTADRRGYPFDWPVLFRVGAPAGTPSILGLGGVIRTCRWIFDGTYLPDSPYGSLTLDDIR
jgi:hypothetical protein